VNSGPGSVGVRDVVGVKRPIDDDLVGIVASEQRCGNGFRHRGGIGNTSDGEGEVGVHGDEE